MDNELEKYMEEEGWIVECESPLEIFHEETESRANGYAAEIVIEYYRKLNRRKKSGK